MENLNAKNLLDNGISHINVGSGQEVTIKDLALLIKIIVGFEGYLVFNSNYPDCMPRKLLDISRIRSMGWKSSIDLDTGIKTVYNWYMNNLQFD